MLREITNIVHASLSMASSGVTLLVRFLIAAVSRSSQLLAPLIRRLKFFFSLAVVFRLTFLVLVVPQSSIRLNVLPLFELAILFLMISLHFYTVH